MATLQWISVNVNETHICQELQLKWQNMTSLDTRHVAMVTTPSIMAVSGASHDPYTQNYSLPDSLPYLNAVVLMCVCSDRGPPARSWIRRAGAARRCSAWSPPASGPDGWGAPRTRRWLCVRRWAGRSEPALAGSGRTPTPCWGDARNCRAWPDPAEHRHRESVQHWRNALRSHVWRLFLVFLSPSCYTWGVPGQKLLFYNFVSAFMSVTCVFQVLQRPSAPLIVGTPLSALTPAPVMMAMWRAFEKTSRNSAISTHKHTHTLNYSSTHTPAS